jgi:hypothetical protein
MVIEDPTTETFSIFLGIKLREALRASPAKPETD